MALTKITANIIEDGAITASAITNTSITADKLHTTLDLTGKAVTVATATAGDNDTTVASTAFVSTAIANLADSAPATLDTLNELAAALGDDANFSTTVTNSIALKAPLASPTFTGTLTASGLVYPTSDGTNGQVLTTDGAGNLSFADAAGGVDGIVSSADATAITIDSAENVEFANNIRLTNDKFIYSYNGGTSGQVRAGFKFDGTNEVVSAYTNQIERMRIDSSGNVGIATTGPGGILDIKKSYSGNTLLSRLWNSEDSNAASNAEFRIVSGNAATPILTFGDSSAVRHSISVDSSDNVLFKHTGSTERMRIDNAGNVGIGTDSPAAVLHISKDVGNTELEALRLSNFDPDQPNNQVGHAVSLSFELPANDGGNTDGKLAAKIVGLTGANLTNDWYTNSASTNFQGQLDFYTRKDDVLTNQMTLNEDGFLGIGTTNPSTELHVYSADQNALKVQTNTGINQIEMANSTNSPTYITANSYALQLKADDNGWGGTNSGIQFRVKNAETFRCDYAGSTFFNTTSGYGTPKYSVMWVKMSSGSQRGISFKATSTSSTDDALLFFNGGAGACGSVTMTYSATSYNTSSDYRLKENVVYDWDATTRLKQLKPCRFNWISDDTNTAIDGFLAHEAAEVVPNAVTGEKDATKDSFLDDDGNEIPGTSIKEQVMDHAKLVPLLVKTIQELEARITALEG